MTDYHRENVGSVGEEAAELLAALQGWAKHHGPDHTGGSAGFGSAYISDGSSTCRVCPVCQLVAALRGINPEALDHIGHAAGSLLSALAAWVESAQRSQSRRERSQSRRETPVQKIDLGDDDPEEPTWP